MARTQVAEIPKILFLDPKNIKAARRNPRTEFDSEEQNTLSENMKELGQIDPIVVEQDGSSYRLISGERRWRAAKKNGQNLIAICRSMNSDEERFVTAVAANTNRAVYSAKEIVNIIAALMHEYSKSDAEIAAIFGKSVGWVSIYKNLMTLKEDLLDRMAPGTPDDKRINLTTAQMLARLPEDEQPLHLARMKNKPVALQRHLTRKTLERGSNGGRKERPSTSYRRFETWAQRAETEIKVWLDTDLNRMFENRSPADVRRGAKAIESIIENLGKLRANFRKL